MYLSCLTTSMSFLSLLSLSFQYFGGPTRIMWGGSFPSLFRFSSEKKELHASLFFCRTAWALTPSTPLYLS